MPPKPDQPQFLGRFRQNRPRLLSLIAGVAALATLIVGAGFAGISKDGSPTASELSAVRIIVIICLIVGIVAYAVGTQRLKRDQG